MGPRELQAAADGVEGETQRLGREAGHRAEPQNDTAVLRGVRVGVDGGLEGVEGGEVDGDEWDEAGERRSVPFSEGTVRPEGNIVIERTIVIVIVIVS